MGDRVQLKRGEDHCAQYNDAPRQVQEKLYVFQQVRRRCLSGEIIGVFEGMYTHVLVREYKRTSVRENERAVFHSYNRKGARSTRKSAEGVAMPASVAN